MISSAAPSPRGTQYQYPAGVKVAPVKRPIDPDTGLPVANTLEGLHAWSPINGDVAAATQCRESGAYWS